MTNIRMSGILVVVTALVSPVAVSAQAGSGVNEQTLREIFALWDRNGDGVVTSDEMSPLGVAHNFDTNKDGTLTREEHRAFYGLGPAANGRQPAPRKGTTRVEQAPDAKANQNTGVRALPAQLPLGKYSCLHIYYDFMQKRMATNPIGTLTVLPGTQYRWFNGATGRFNYDASKGTVRWLSGIYAQPQATTTVEWAGSKLMIKSVIPAGGKTTTHRCYPQA